MQRRADSSTPGRADSSPRKRTASTPAAKPETRAERGHPIRSALKMWLADGRSQGWSERTVDDREKTLLRVCWWLEHEAEVSPTLANLDAHRIREFLAYAREPRKGGRYGGEHSQCSGAVRPATVNAYFRTLRAFLNFCLAEGLLQETPLTNVKAPKIPKDQIQPFTVEQVQQLLDAARGGPAPDRDAAVILTLLDTGMRVSEVIGLTLRDFDRSTGSFRVIGKGNKERSVYIGTSARRAVWRYVESERRDALAEEALFVAIGGHQRDAGLGYTGVYQIVKRAGTAAGIEGVRCSPHTLRHTFAISFLRNGGNLFELQELMGHEDVTVLRKYVKLAAVDLEQAHRKASPADRMKLR